MAQRFTTAGPELDLPTTRDLGPVGRLGGRVVRRVEVAEEEGLFQAVRYSCGREWQGPELPRELEPC